MTAATSGVGSPRAQAHVAGRLTEDELHAELDRLDQLDELTDVEWRWYRTLEREIDCRSIDDDRVREGLGLSNWSEQ